MTTAIARCFALSSLFLLVSQGFGQMPASQAEPTLEITVDVFNHAQVPKGMLGRAQAEATRIFREAGVNMAWSTCPVSAADTTCRKRLRPTDTVLRILPRSMAESLGLDPSTFGYALPARKGGFGSLTNVFFHRLEELNQRRYGRSLILGHLMAHEMGHLLLGIGSHSDRGIMHFPWRPKQLDRAAKGNMLFTPAQAKRIRTQVRDRMRAQIREQMQAAQASQSHELASHN